MSANLKPLTQYAEENKNSMNDPTVLSYLLTRCGAFYTFVSAITYEKNRELADTLQKNSVKLLSLNAQLMMTKFDRTAEEAFKSTDDVHKRMSKFYKEDGQEFFAKTGEYISGTPLKGDLDICSELLNMVQQNLKTFAKTFRGKMSYKKIDKYVDLVRRTLDPDDYFNIEIQYDEGWQYIRIEVWDRVLH